jgi:hypothetical protein
LPIIMTATYTLSAYVLAVVVVQALSL